MAGFVGNIGKQVVWKADGLLKKIERADADALRKAGAILAKEARRRAPRGKTGKLRKSIRVLKSTKDTVFVGSKWFVARFIELGTKAHALKGRDRAGRKVERGEHPGTAAKAFLRPALDAVWNDIQHLWTGKLK